MDNNSKQGFAVASFVLALIGLFAFGFVLGPLAIIFGIISVERGLGKAGLIIGIIDLFLLLALWSFIFGAFL
jgi:hypothetical protein